MDDGAHPTAPHLLALVYCDEWRKYGYSLDEQIRLGRGYCAADERRYLLDDDLIFSGDESGKKPVEQRPILRALIAAVMAGRVDVVVRLVTSRLTCDRSGAGRTVATRIRFVSRIPSPVGRD